MATQDFSHIKQQLPLPVLYSDELNFADFCWTGNELLQQQILTVLPKKQEHLFYVWGCPGSGKSHLLQATCQVMSQMNYTVAYLPLKLLHDWEPAILEGMAQHDMVAVDDIDQIAGLSDWEEALFHLYNHMSALQNVLLVSAQAAPIGLKFCLSDLRSRLMSGLTIQIHEIVDMDKVLVLQEQAKKRGLALSESVGQFIIQHYARNMHSLHAILDQLDHASLVAQRKLTIPFVKDILK